MGMIKYIWIFMIVIVDIIWSIRSITDIIYCIRSYNINYIFDWLDFSTNFWLFVHIGGIFCYSLMIWFKT